MTPLILIIIVTICILLPAILVWWAFRKRAVLFHFDNPKDNLIFGRLSYRGLYILFVIHIVCVIFISSFIIIYVW